MNINNPLNDSMKKINEINKTISMLSKPCCLLEPPQFIKDIENLKKSIQVPTVNFNNSAISSIENWRQPLYNLQKTINGLKLNMPYFNKEFINSSSINFALEVSESYKDFIDKLSNFSENINSLIYDTSSLCKDLQDEYIFEEDSSEENISMEITEDLLNNKNLILYNEDEINLLIDSKIDKKLESLKINNNTSSSIKKKILYRLLKLILYLCLTLSDTSTVDVDININSNNIYIDNNYLED